MRRPVMNANLRDESIAPHFLAGGGESGARMRAVDWNATPLGDPENWPQSLKTIVRVMLDSRYAMWMLWGPEYTFFCNDAYLPTVGIRRDWVMGARSDKVWSEIWADIGPRIATVLEKGQATWDEGLLLYLERSGFPEETYHTFSYSPVYDDENRIAGMLCVVTEITERVLSERGLGVLRDLAARGAGSQLVRQACEELIAVLGDDPLDVPFACLYVIESSGARAWLASSCGCVPSALAPELVALTDGTAAWPIGAVAHSGVPEVIELPDREHSISAPLWPDRVTRAVILPVKGAGPTATAVLVAGVSPRRVFDEHYQRFYELVAAQFSAALNAAHAYEAERTRAEGLAALDRAKMQFFSNVSHEFRTPLTLLLGPIEELLADPRLPSAARQHLALAQRNSLRLLKLVNSLLDFSRIESGRVQASYEATDLAQLTRDLASNFRSAIERAGLSLEVDSAPLAMPVHVDRDMWEKIVLNLLSNAFKFTLQGSITVRLQQQGDAAVLEVTDTGVGIPADAISRLFERFYRIEGSQGRTHEGSGIGLALVQELVKLHGGSIEVESEPGRGSRFRVRVPLGTDHLPADRIKAPRALASTAIGAQAFVQEALRWIPDDSPTSELAGLPESGMLVEDQRFASTFGAHILLADDNADMRVYVTELLAPCYRIEAVADGREAIDAALRTRPDLIVSDVMMPRLDGFGLLKEVREQEALRDVPVILLSARAGEEARIEGFDSGADDYLVKPFSARELLARVGSMLERQRLHRNVLEQERRAQNEVRLRMTQLEAADRQKDEFLAMLAHELRNPLAPIHNAGELLSRTLPPDPRAEAAIGIVKRQVGHLTRLVDDLLDVSRITQGRIELRRRPLQLSEVIAQAVETVEPMFRDKQHRVTVTSGYTALQVYGDPARLVQCVENILTNAAKYTDSQGDIHIESRGEDGMAVLTITDNGVGIAPDLLPRVFDLFVQSQRTLDRAQGGLGIGLCVVKRLIQMHGGTVTAASAGLGCGSTFEFRLPLIVPGHVHHAEEPIPEVPPQRILIVDDNKDVAESLAMLLTLEKHDVVSVYAPRAALERYPVLQPDVVLMDIGLPEIDGYELARRLRALPGRATVRFIALTGYGQSEDRQRAREAGFDAHLVKPVDLATLQRTLAG